MDTKLERRSFLKSTAGLAGAALLAQVFPFRQGFAAHAASVAGGGIKAAASAYDLAEGLTYLNHASIGTMPRKVREAYFAYIQACETNPWLHIWGDVWREGYQSTRERAAALMGCDPEETAMVHNTTEAMNVLAAGLPLGAGDEVLFSSLNHSGASVCWDHYAESRGFSVKKFDFPVLDAPSYSNDDLVRIHTQQITDKTKVLVVPHVDNVLGIRLPMKQLADAARKLGVSYIAVDGAQSAGMFPFELSKMGIDFYATSPHKWMQSPKGRGLFYIRKDLLDHVRPLCVTWGRARWKDDARKFEDYGTRDMPSMLALDDALQFQLALGSAAKEKHFKALWAHAKARVEADPRLIWRSPKQWGQGSGLYAIERKGVKSKEIFDVMYEQHGFVFRPFSTDQLESFRLSPGVMNTTDDLDRFFDTLAKAFKA